MSFRMARRKALLTQRQAAEQIGVSDTAIVQWERHGSIPRGKLLPKIAEVYGCTIADLFKEDE